MSGIMKGLRADITDIGGIPVVSCEDYATGLMGLPKSDMLKYRFKDGSSVVVRPSGTEPKLKLYLSVAATGKAEAEKTERVILADLEKRIR